ncbi:hypothetical protein K437DRAFT_138392 [Tilletiaria anomala UBC 951]|uniref:DH domain-containing protein n=1 Tax=Tilletiaria anomala (strain ATCC 24038 / CBS 436.72 / UBC 951) TaxID=1037660 RepID=A0A066VRN4_TILAU|nr:uncharacterized protein K437DRAFT_138392 [Tilletiaria anomala UBC 951]KDN44357.1 hypothetical protein K437DRAFT_138392 [Tilletiaria anomala UBC 951]
MLPNSGPDWLRFLHVCLCQVLEERRSIYLVTHLQIPATRDDKLPAFLDSCLLTLQAQLLVLDISDCGLTSLPTSICTCTFLEELNISCNPIQGGLLPSWLDELASLKVLVADDLSLAILPFALSSLTKLETLSVRNNILQQLPSWLHLLRNVKRLCIEGNPFFAPWLTILGPLLTISKDAVVSPLRSAPLKTPAISASTSVSSLISLQEAQQQQVSPSGTLPRANTSRSSLGRLRQMRSISDMARGKDCATQPPADSPDTSKGESHPTADKPLPPIQNMNPTSTSSIPLPPMPPDDVPFEDGTVRSSGLRLRIGGDGSTGTSSKWAFSLRRKSRKEHSNRLNIMPDMSSGKDDASRSGASSTPSVTSAMSSSSGSARVAEFGVTEAPMSPFAAHAPPTFAQVSSPAEMRRRNRLSYLPISSVMTQSTEPNGVWDEVEMGMHLKRVKALMQYLRDLDDLCNDQVQQDEEAESEAPTRPYLKRMQSSGNISMSAISTRSSDHAFGGRPTPASSRRPSEITLNSMAQSMSTNGFTTPEETCPPPLPPMPNMPKCKDDAGRRKKIVAEIISSEETYVQGLQDLVDIYVKPAQAYPTTAPIPLAEQRIVFGNIEALRHFHQGAFLPALKAAAAPLLSLDDAPAELSAHTAEDVSSVFSRHAAFFRMYSTYINNCEAAQARVAVWLAPVPSGAAAALKNAKLGGSHHVEGDLTPSQRKIMQKFLKRCRSNPRHTQISIESYLLLPVQRIPRYRLLLEDLLRSTPPSLLRNQATVQDALTQISDIAMSVNESKRQAEQDKRLWEWQDRITGHWPSPLVQPHRRLIKDGALLIRRVVKRSSAYVQADQPSFAGAEAQSTSVLAIDALQQQAMNKPVVLLLCNDIAVVLSTPLGARTDKPTTFELYAVLRIKQQKECEIVGGTNVRVVDSKTIIYFAAQTPAEAAAWRDAIQSCTTSTH